MGANFEDAKTWLYVHRPEILGIAGGVLGVAAFGSAIYVTHKYGSADYNEMRVEHGALVTMLDRGEITEEEFREKSRRNTKRGILNLAKDYAIPVGLEISSNVCFALAGNDYHNRLVQSALDLSSAAATIALMKSNALENYGEEGLKKITTIPKTKTVKKKVEDSEEFEDIEIAAEDPELLAVDKVAYADSIKYGLPYSPTRIRLDERFCYYNNFGGEIASILYPLSQSVKTANEELWNRGKITVWDILNHIGLESQEDPSIDKDMAEKYGIVDKPEVYDLVTKKMIKVPGFNNDPFATQYPDTSSHKRISFGPAVDAMLDDEGMYDYYINKINNDYFLSDDGGKEYLYLDIGVDGNITTWKVGYQPADRKRSAWHQNPETQQ